MQGPSRPVTGYPVPNVNGCAPNPPPPSAATATAYPYQNPNPYPYTYYQQPLPSQSPRATFARRLLFVFAAVLIIFGSIIFITWLVLRPRLPDFSLQSLSLPNYNSSTERVTATWDARFLVSNPNKKLSVSYSDVYSSVYYHGYDLADSRMPPFEQGTRNVTTIETSFSLVDAYIKGDVVDAINKDRSNGQVKFDVFVSSWVGFRYGGWRGRRRVLRVSCGNVALNSSSGKMLGVAKGCDVY
ncbi:hypothetical protein SLEP1_g7322 [Rubroshorea leprosula]|uniref:Late embryogenesis abundant protein LEA-2 subgroup domain-containing protein n=1 Tax=Rubroshorea leprosula TaxID=152421 RepID=A0AAV5I3Z8_9ROSI|nr:hypothetical protein SLEP1_g7322 [Rubroshorea leprosula]